MLYAYYPILIFLFVCTLLLLCSFEKVITGNGGLQAVFGGLNNKVNRFVDSSVTVCIASYERTKNSFLRHQIDNLIDMCEYGIKVEVFIFTRIEPNQIIFPSLYCSYIKSDLKLKIVKAKDSGKHFAYECRKCISSLTIVNSSTYVILEDDVSLTLKSLLAYWEERQFLIDSGWPNIHPFLPRYELRNTSTYHYAPDIILNCGQEKDYLCYVFDKIFEFNGRWYVKPMSQYAGSLIYLGSDVNILKGKGFWTTSLRPNTSFPQEDAVGLNDYPYREYHHGSAAFVRMIPLTHNLANLRVWHMTNKFQFPTSVNLDDLIRCSGFEIKLGHVVRVSSPTTCRILRDQNDMPTEPKLSSMWKNIEPF